MALTLYRRHRPKCEASDHHPEGSRTAEFQERRKAINAAAAKFTSLARSADASAADHAGDHWDDARTFAATVEERPRDQRQPSMTRATPDPATVTRHDRGRLHGVHQVTARAPRSRGATLRKYRTFTKQLMAFADSRGYVMIDQWQPGDVDRFYAALEARNAHEGKAPRRLAGVLPLLPNRKWILETPVSSDMKPPKGSSASADKMPFSDAELERIMTACDNPPRLMKQRDRDAGQVGCEYKNDAGPGEWTGEDLKDLIELMLHTGFRISDATLFDMSRLQGNSVMIRARKNGNHVFAWLPDSCVTG